MAVAAASIRSLLHALSSIHTTNSAININNPSLISFPTINNNLFESKPLYLKKTTLKPSHFHPRLLFSSSSFAPYAEQTDEEVSSYNREEDEDEDEDEEQEEEETEIVAETSPPVEASRLYVGNLPYSMTSSQLADIFNEAGTVKSVEIVYDRVTDRSRGFAFITMANNDDANNAIRMFDGSQVGGQTVKVNFPEVPRGGEREVMGPQSRASRGYVDSPFKVYCGNLGWTVTSESLNNAFADLPGLLGAKVIYEHDSGRSRGFGFVSFTSLEEAQSVIEAMNGKEVEGRPLRLNLASERSSATSAAL